MSGIFLTSTGGGLKNLDKPLLAGNTDADSTILQIIPRNKLLECVRDQLLWLRIGLRQNLRILDVVESIGDDLITFLVTTQRLSALCPISIPQTCCWFFAISNFLGSN